MIMQIHKLAIKVEEMYTKHFANGERKKAMIELRPVRRRGSHWTTFFLGELQNIENRMQLLCELVSFHKWMLLLTLWIQLFRVGAWNTLC